MNYDLCIVGAGVAGMSAAITASKGGLSVLLLEKNKKTGCKIYAAGNGRCNLTNMNIDVNKNYNSSDNSYGDYLQQLYGEGKIHRKLSDFFKEIGLAVYADPYGYVYPCSNQASGVAWAMNDAMADFKGDKNKGSVTVVTNAAVTEIRKNSYGFTVDYMEKKENSLSDTANFILLACGGNSYEKLGGSMAGYRLAEGLGHSITDIKPALCGLETQSQLHSADGVRVKTTAKLLINGKEASESTGEVQITSYGLSGIAVFNLSSKANTALKNGEAVELAMNLLENAMQHYGTEEQLVQFMVRMENNRTIFGALNGIVNEKLALYALEKQGIYPKERLMDISSEKIMSIITELTRYHCQITGSKGFDMAQVTAGGVRLSEIDMESFESRIVPGVYITGEMLDIDGICGGYNITFALMSGITAAENIIKKHSD